MWICLYSFILINSIYSEEFYLKPTGINSTSCNTYQAACGTIDYIMQTCINSSNRNSIVYIDSGSYIYNIVAAENSAANAFSNLSFNFTPYILSTFNVNDFNTYPVIISNVGSSNTYYFGFYFYANVSASFQYLKFFIGSNSYANRYLFGSFFILFIFYLFLGSRANDNISVSVIDCVFSTDFSAKSYIYIQTYYGNFSIENCLLFIFFILF
jgi:hypothetical protein